MKHHHHLIGTVNHGIDGLDFYYLLKLDDQDFEFDDQDRALDYMHKMFLHSVYLPARGPGSRFCHTALVLPKNDTEFIGIAQVRYDV